MFTNLSKEKRDGLLSKIVTICAYIAAAPRNKNTSNLLTYLSDLEQDVNVKKYGLVFKEHQEAIDTVLAEHTPVLTEERSLLIDNGGGMNFLLEGDNLAALQLLEKTHRGRIGLIYIEIIMQSLIQRTGIIKKCALHGIIILHRKGMVREGVQLDQRDILQFLQLGVLTLLLCGE